MNYDNHDLFFAKVLQSLIENPEMYSTFKRLGLKKTDIPSSSIIRKHFETFIKHAEKKEFEMAIMKTNNIRTVPSLDYEIDPIFFSTHYRGFVDRAKGRELVTMLSSNPSEYVSVLERFRRDDGHSVKLFDVVEIYKSQIEKHLTKSQTGTAVIKIPGWPKLSEMINGFNPGTVHMITAMTGIGKTNLSLNLALSAKKELNCIFFNMEMPIEDIFARIAMMGSNVDRNEWNRLHELQGPQHNISAHLSKLRDEKGSLHISDGRAISITDLTKCIYQENEKRKLDIIFIDYDQKIRVEGLGEQWQQLHSAIESIEEIAKDCGVCIVILGQADEAGDPKASRRMKQSMTSVLWLYEENQNFYIKPIKNRNFAKVELEIHYWPEKSQCAEFDYVDPTVKEIQGAKNRLKI